MVNVNPECAMIDLKWSRDSGGYNKIVHLNLPLKAQFNNTRAILLTYSDYKEIIVNDKMFDWTPWEVIFHDDINKIRVSRGLEEAEFPRMYQQFVFK